MILSQSLEKVKRKNQSYEQVHAREEVKNCFKITKAILQIKSETILIERSIGNMFQSK